MKSWICWAAYKLQMTVVGPKQFSIPSEGRAVFPKLKSPIFAVFVMASIDRSHIEFMDFSAPKITITLTRSFMGQTRT